MRPKTIRIKALLTLLVALALPLHAQTSNSANIAATDVYISGSSLALEDVTATTGLNIPVSIQTSFGGLKNEQAPVVPELTAAGDLTGPGIDTPIQLQTAPGHAFQIPGLSTEGVYLLQNVRLMRGSTFVQSASPASAAITVADVLKTKVSVRQLTAAELRARGITIDARNFDVYEYTLSFFVGTQEVLVPFPVIVDKRTHEMTPVGNEPKYSIPGFKNAPAPPRWGPPTVSPMELGEDDAIPGPPDQDKEPGSSSRPTIPAAIVIPNSLGVLHQFFAVALTVTNNAPDGSSITLDSINATLKNPPELRIADTKPAVSFGRPVPLVDPNSGTTILVAQAKAEADWTLEGLKTGTHTFQIEVHATYKASTTADPIPLKGVVTQQIVIHDPRFNVTFSHPDTVRQGLTYSTFTFVTNMTTSTQTIRLRTDDELPACSAAGAANVCRLDDDISNIPLCSANQAVDLCRPADDLKAEELTLKPGATRTVVYKLRSNLTGNVFATAGSVDSDVAHVAVQLHMGVSTSGIPLSPATLVMPYYAQYLDQQFVTDNLQLLGLGYSLATAPVNQVTASQPRVITTDVFHRAVDIARAGQRIFIGEDRRDTLANLTLDLLGNGNGNRLAEWDELRRREWSGRVAGASLGRQLEAAGLKTGGDFDGFLARFGQTTAWRAPYFMAIAHGAPVNGNSRPYALSLRGVTSNGVIDVPNELATEDSLGKRELAFGDLTRLTSGDNAQTGEMLSLGVWSENYELTVTPVAGSSFTLDILYPSTTATHIQHAIVSVTNTSGRPLKAVLDPASSQVTLTEDGGGASYSGNATTLTPSPLAIVAAHQDMHLDDGGHKVSVLFNRPVDTTVDYKPKFNGRVVFNQGAVSYTGPRGVDAAALQDDERTLNLTFDHALSTNATYSIQVQTLTDVLTGVAATFSDLVPALENNRPAGIIYGRVLHGDNTIVPGAQVRLAAIGITNGLQYDTASADKGDFLFEYVLRDVAAGVQGAYELSAVDADGKSVSVSGAVRLTGVVETVNLVYLGRGSAEGRVTYDNGDVVPNAKVVVGSTLFNQFRTAVTGTDGRYSVQDLPVGPLTFSATDGSGNAAFAASEIRSAGQIVTQDISIYRQPFPGTGTIRGIVVRSDTQQPVANAHVGVYTQGYGLTDGFTDANGKFEFDKVVTGLVTVLAEDWSIARKAVGEDFDLANDQVQDLKLTLEVIQDQPLANLEGDVEEENPLSPGTFSKVPGAMVQIHNFPVVIADANGHFAYQSLPLSASNADIKVYNPVSKRAAQSKVPALDPAVTAYIRIPILVSDAFGTGTVQVRVLNASGLPVSNLRVFEPGYPTTPFAPIGDGKYELHNVRVGSGVSVMVTTSGDASDPLSSRYTYGEQTTSGNASVAFNGQTSLTVLRLPGQGKVRVRLFTDIQDIGDVLLTFRKWSEEEQQMMPYTVTQSTKDPATGLAGYAIFDKVPVGGFSVAASLANFGYDSAGGNFAYDGQVLDIDLHAKKLASLAGVVYNIDGLTPMPGVTVKMTDGGQTQTSTTTLDGSFKFGNVAAARSFTITAETVVNGANRMGITGGVTPANGGPVNNIAVRMKQEGSIEGYVVYSGYKVFDPNDPSKNVLDPTPNDLSDNARVPLAQFYLRELSYPYRTWGTQSAPLTADINGHFIINNVVEGGVRLTGWSQTNQDLRGDGTTTLVQEGSTATVYAGIGAQGFGPVAVTVVDPNNHNAPVENAEVALAIPVAIGPPVIFDFGTTDANGAIRFEQVPARSYHIDAFSKLVGKGGSADITVQPVTGASAVVSLQFSGSINGKLSDPEAANAGVPGVPVLMYMSTNSYQQQASTQLDGTYFIGGVHEGTFTLDALQESSRRRAHAQGAVSAADPNPTINLELEHTSSLYVKVFYPNDDGSMSNVEVPTSDIEAKQRCTPIPLTGGEICEYKRTLQGAGLVFTNLLAASGYTVSATEIGGDGRGVAGSGTFPVGATADNPFKLKLPAFGTIEVTVRQPGTGGAMEPAAGARVSAGSIQVTTDTNGLAVMHHMPLGDYSVGAVSFDNRYSSYSPTVSLGSQSTPLQVTIDLASSAGITGIVNAETGGPSINTRVVAGWPGHSAMTFTDGTGTYKFQGITVSATQNTSVGLTYYGPDDKTAGAAQGTTLTAGDIGTLKPLPPVTLDATPPSVVSFTPDDNSVNVSPDTSITVSFSEPIAVNTINGGNFRLQATDGSAQVNCAITSYVDPNSSLFTVKMTPPPSSDPAQRFPLKSNMLYKVLFTSGITDLTGHALTPRGFSFITADYVAPKIIQVEPATNVPLSESTTFLAHFNKPLDPALFNANHNVVAPLEVHLYKLDAPGGNQVSEVPGVAYGDQANQVVTFAPSDKLLEKSYYRLKFIGVRDALGNAADPISFDYFSFDKTAPFITFDPLPTPAGTPLVSGIRYTLHTLMHDGDASGPLSTDVARVDFFQVNGTSKTLLTSLTRAPYDYAFVAPVVTTTGTSLTFHVEAYDTSFNNATPQEITFDVAPNLPPQNVTLTLKTPDPIYPGVKVSAQPSLTDEGLLVTLQAQLTGTNSDGTAYTSTRLTGQANRTKTSDPWVFTPATFDFFVPASLADGSTASITMTANDGVNASVDATPATFTVAADTNPPVVSSVTVSPASPYHLNDKYTITAVVKDAESGISDVTFTYDGITTAPMHTGDSGVTKLADGSYRFVSAQITVPAKNDDTKIAIIAAARDLRGNKGTGATEVTYIGVHDTTLPKGAWVAPVGNAAWPSDQTSFATTLRIWAKDDQAITGVKFVVPGLANPVDATAAGNDLYTATITVATPAAGTDFSISALVSDADPTHTQTLTIPITLVKIDATLPPNFTQAITSATDPLLNKNVLVQGPNTHLVMHVPFTFKNLIVLDGGVVETLASTTSSEKKLDITVSDTLYVDSVSSIDVSGKGYLGGWANNPDSSGTKNNDPRGRTAGNTNTGGAPAHASASHGGVGAEDGASSNATYDSIIAPRVPGAGGGGAETCCTAGGTGGGAAAITGGSSGSDLGRIILAGSLRADGLQGGASSGAGGSIRVSGHMVSLGYSARIAANGGDEFGANNANRGGGGGRVSVIASEQLDLDSTLPQLQARGGRNLAGEGRTQLDAGAGTVFVRRPGQQFGELALSSLDERAPSTTHLTRHTILGYTGTGNSTSLTASSLTDSSRTFASDAVGEELRLGGDATKSYTITAVSPDGHTLTTDSADGSLLDAPNVNNGVVAYSGLLQFDAIRVTDRALARFDDAFNDSAAVTTATNAVLLRVTDVPQVASFTSTPAGGAQLIRGTSFTTGYSATSAAGIGSASLTFSPAATPVTDNYFDYASPATQSSKTIAVPSDATLGAATLTLSLTDRAGRKFTSAPINFTVVDNAAPVITKFDVTPSSLQMYAGHTITIDAAASDDVAVTALTLTASAGTLTSQAPVTNGNSMTRSFSVAVPPATKGGTNVDLTLSATDGFAGRTPTQQTARVAITTDPNPPAINVTSPAVNQTFQVSSNVTIPVRAVIADAEVGVDPATVFVSLGGAAPVALVPDSSVTNGWKADLPVPSVDGTAAVPKSVVVTAKDYEGNPATTAPGFNINIQPVFDPNGPIVAWLCPSVGSGAIYPSGYTAIFRVSATGASSDNGVTAVKFYVGNSSTPITATLTSGAYQASVPLPTGAEGTLVPLRVEATSIRNNVTSVTNTITLIAGGTTISSNTSINATNTTYENQTVIITGGTVTIDGTHTFARLLVLDGANVTHTSFAGGGTGVNVTVTGASYISCNGTIDVSGQGYAASLTYPGATAPGSNSGGSHIGTGGLYTAPTGSTFGSIYRPREAGGGANGANAGGGVVRLIAGSFANDGAIRANGQATDRSSAGGSIWITATTLGGNGVTEANGIDLSGGTAAGGGGAISVEYTNLGAGSTVLNKLTARGGSSGNSRPGMAGTVYTKSTANTWGDVVVDNKGTGNPQGNTTDFPSLGGGTAQSGSSGAILVTDRTVNIPTYFEGHWIEITSSTGTLKGTWRISPGSINNKTVTLQANGNETISVQPGDKWQGVYHFDTLRTNNGEPIHSGDPIRLGVNGVVSLAGPTAVGQYLELVDTINATDVTVTGNVSVLTINTTNLTVKNGAVLTVPKNGTTPNALTLNVTGTMTIENGGAVDVSSRGYADAVTYPGATEGGSGSGGTHIGIGGIYNGPTGTTFGSIYRPREAGGGGNGNNAPGGGIVRITAATLNHDGAIRANGQITDRSGAGGSIWITATNLNGAGTIDANGGDLSGGTAAGGGGAISVEYTNLGASATVLNKLTAKGGSSGNSRPGMAGTVYTKSTANTWGDVVVDYKGTGNPQGNTTDFPSLGGGTAQSGSSGASLVTDRTVNIPTYFEGHWIEITSSTGTLKGTWRIAPGSINNKTVTLQANGNETISVQPGDKWQGVYHFDTLRTNNGEPIHSADPIRLGVNGVLSLAGPTAAGQYLELVDTINATDVTVTGNVSVLTINTTNLTVKSGAVLTVPKNGTTPNTLALNVTGTMTVEAGGAVDVSTRGYADAVTYPGATEGGSGSGGTHIGIGGIYNGPTGTTFGSIYRPREAGGGGNGNNAPGGGIVRIIAATLNHDGAIRANGQITDRSGAGGSIWITATNLNGAGTIDANGGDLSGGTAAGGGGAISVEYTNLGAGATVLTKLTAKGGSSGNSRPGMAGTVYTKSTANTWGDVVVDNKGTGNPQGITTDFPSLGGGTAQSGSSGAILVTDRTVNIPTYFEGHWIEITSSTGTLKGTWRISPGSINNKTVTLQANGNETIDVQPGDKWQGVYHFDTLRTNNGEPIHSGDPIRLGVNGVVSLSGPTAVGQYLELFDAINATDVTVTGNVSVLTINTTNLTVKSGAVLTTPTNGTTPNTLTLNVTGTMTVENGGAVDVSSRGYADAVTYPGATEGGGGSGGTHIGIGGIYNGPTGTTFGSIYRPREAGGGGNGSSAPGGGIVRITAATLNHDGAIRANGQITDRSGAGGSIWITATNLNGAGTVDANGGNLGGGFAAGGGGAISVEYTNLGAGATVLNKLTARGGSSGNNRPGMAGTVYTKGPASTWGDAVVDNKGTGNPQGIITDFPSLGGGTAQSGSSGASLVTDRSVNIPTYFEGHWIEITSSTGTLKGTWRIAPGSINNKTVTLQANGNETIDVQPGDKWQGVYHFDTLRTNNGEPIHSADPIRLGVNGVVSLAGPTAAGQYLELFDAINATDVTVTGNVSVVTINTTNLTVKNGAVLTVPKNGTTPNALTLNVTGTLTVENGGAVDVTSRGYADAVTYPGATEGGSGNGGTHIGIGGLYNTPLGTTFGSVYRPREAGGGGNGNSAPGGGIVRITAATLNHDGAIRANGQITDRSGAGGSIWITATNLNGAGTVDANGGDLSGGTAAGGGGAISVEYTNLGAGATVLNKLTARGGTSGNNRPGAAGSVFVLGPSPSFTYGDLTIDNKTVAAASAQLTELQALGIGIAQSGSSGANLVTDRATNIPGYFEGHWVNVTDANGVVKGSWRIAPNGINNKSVTLAPNGSETISIQPGDHWRGSYKFDHLTLKNDNFQTADLVELGNPISATSSTYQLGNVSAPAVDVTKFSFSSSAAGPAVVAAANAVTDSDGPILVTVTNQRTTASWTTTINSGAAFTISVAGNQGDTILVRAKDSHKWPLESTDVSVGTLPSGSPTVTQIDRTTLSSDTNFRPRLLATDGVTLAVAGNSDKVALMNVVDPSHAVLQRTVTIGNGTISRIAISNNWLYVASNDLAVLDLSSNTSTPVIMSDPGNLEVTVAVSGSYVFTAPSNYNDGRIRVYDAAVPSQTRFLRDQGFVSSTTFRDLIPYGNRYLVAITPDTPGGVGHDVVVLDRGDINSIVKIADLDIPSFAATRGRINGTKLYLVGNTGEVVIVDLTTPSAPAVAGRVGMTSFATGITSVETEVFAAAQSAGLMDVNAANPASPFVAGGVNVGGTAYDVAVNSPYAFVANDNGIAVVPVAVAPQINVARISMSMSGNTATISGSTRAISGAAPVTLDVADVTHAFTATTTANGDGSFSVTNFTAQPGDTFTIKATDTAGRVAGPVTIGSLPFTASTVTIPITSSVANNDNNFRARTLAIDGNKLGVVGWFSGSRLVVYDVTNPAQPATPPRVVNTFQTYGLATKAGYAYIAADNVESLDLNGSTGPLDFGDPGNLDYAIAVSGTYAYTAPSNYNDGRIRIYDIGDTAHPRFIRDQTFIPSVQFRGLTIYGDYLLAFSSDTPGGRGHDLVVIDRRDTNTLQLVADVDITGFDAFRGKIVGTTLYLAGAGGGIAAVDLTNPAAPVVTKVATADAALGLDISGNTLAVADRSAGVTFFDISSPLAPAKIATQPISSGMAWDVAFNGGNLYVANEQGVVVLQGIDAPPMIQPALIGITSNSQGTATITGAVRAINGVGPFSVKVTNVRTTASITVPSSDGSFSVQLPANAGDSITVTATDNLSHTSGPLTAGIVPFGTAITNLPITSTLTTDSNFRTRTLALTSNKLVVSGWFSGSRVLLYDVANPASPVNSPRVVNTPQMYGLSTLKNYAVFAADNLQTLDVTNSASTTNDAGDPGNLDYSVTTSGNYAFSTVSNYNDGRIRTYDLTNPALPRFISDQALISGVTFRGITTYGDNYLIAFSDSTASSRGHDIVIIDRRDVNGMKVVADLDIPNFLGFRGKVSGTTLYAAGYSTNIAVVDLRNINSPTWQVFATPGQHPLGVDVAGSTLAIADGGAGVTFYDVTNALQPARIGTQPTGGMAWDVLFNADNLYVANETGLVVINGVGSAPVIRPSLITITSDGAGNVQVAGAAGAITGYPTISAEVRNASRTVQSVTVNVNADGSFTTSSPINAFGGESISIVATDGANRVSGPVVIGTVPFGIVSNLLVPGNFRARTVAAAGNRLLVAGWFTGNSVAIYDITTPQTPQLLRTVTVGGNVTGISINNGWASISADNLNVLDLSSSTATPIDLGDPGNLEYSVVVSGSYAITTVSNYNDGRVRVYDVSDPTHARLHSEFSLLAGVTFRGITAYGDDYVIAFSDTIAGNRGHDIVIIDKRDVDNLRVLSDIDVANFDGFKGRVGGKTLYAIGYRGGMAVVDLSGLPNTPPTTTTSIVPSLSNSIAGIDVTGSTIALGDGTGVTFFDASTPLAPVLLGSQATGGMPWDVKFYRGQLYVANEQGFAVIQNVASAPIVEKAQLTLTNDGTTSTFTAAANAFTGLGPISVAVSNGTATVTRTVAADGSIASVSLAGVPGSTITVTATGRANRVTSFTMQVPFGAVTSTIFAGPTQASNDAAFRSTRIAIDSGATMILAANRNWSSSRIVAFPLPGSSGTTRVFTAPGTVRDFTIAGTLAVVAADNLMVVDLGNPSSTQINLGDPGNFEAAVAVSGNTVFTGVTNYNDGRIREYDITNPAAPAFVRDVTGLSAGITWRKLIPYGTDYLVALSSDSGSGRQHDVAVFNRTNLAAISVVNDNTDIANFTSVDGVIDGSTLYVTGGDAGVAIIDLTTPAAPVVKSVIDTPGVARGITVSGTNEIAVADSAGEGITFIDVTDKVHPVIKGYQTLPGSTADVKAVGKTLYSGSNMVLNIVTRP